MATFTLIPELNIMIQTGADYTMSLETKTLVFASKAVVYVLNGKSPTLFVEADAEGNAADVNRGLGNKGIIYDTTGDGEVKVRRASLEDFTPTANKNVYSYGNPANKTVGTPGRVGKGGSTGCSHKLSQSSRSRED